MRRRFELREGESTQTWICDWVEQTTSPSWWDGLTLPAFFETLVDDKLADGFTEVHAESRAPDPSLDETPRAALERRLSAAPEDHGSWSVYADMLAEAGDPRAELITIGIALACGRGHTDSLRDREAALLHANAESWFGRFVTDAVWRENFAWTLKTGFWGEVRIGLGPSDGERELDRAAALGHALDLDSGRFLRNIVLALAAPERDNDPGAWSRELAKRGPLASLRRLDVWSVPTQIWGGRGGWGIVGDVDALWSLLPNIEHIRLWGKAIELGEVHSDSLQSLSLCTTGLSAKAAASLAQAVLPRLEFLEVWFGAEDCGGECGSAEVRALLSNPSFAQLHYLGLANADFADGIADVVIEAGLPRTLRVLDLSKGNLTDRGARRLLEGVERLAGLQTLVLRSNSLSAELCDRLDASLPEVEVLTDDQNPNSNIVSYTEIA